MDQTIEAETNKETTTLPDGYLECTIPECNHFGLVKIPPEKQVSWSDEAAKKLKLDRFVTADCPGCKSSYPVHLAEEIAPDYKNAEELNNWLNEKLKKPHSGFSHLDLQEARKRTLAQIKSGLANEIRNNTPEIEINKYLADSVSSD